MKNGHQKRILRKLQVTAEPLVAAPTLTPRDIKPRRISVAPENNGRHIMLSYEWGTQQLVKEVFDELKQLKLNVWMDIEGGVTGDINRDMACAVENAGALLVFMNTGYQNSRNCEMELCYAREKCVPIIPIMATADRK